MRNVLVAALAVVCAGCVSTRARCRVAVENVTDQAIEAVTVLFGHRGEAFALGDVPPDEISRYERVDPEVMDQVTIQWLGGRGRPVREELKLEKPLAREFRGRVVFQLSTNAAIRVFVLPEPGSRGGDMPWTRPQSWEGSPLIPGLNQAE